MTPDAQPPAPAGLHPETAVICVGRPGHAAGKPLNVPVVLASNFHASAMAAPGLICVVAPRIARLLQFVQI
jgi:hypothetical protein